MSSLRKLERANLRKQYERFCEAWRNEKLFQKIATEAGQTIEDQYVLGKKPTFSMWLKAKKNGAFAPKPVEDKRVEVGENPSWEE